MEALENVYTADFETTTDAADCRVWLWAAQRLLDDSTFWGKDVKSFFKFISRRDVGMVWFHNLAFDGKFVIDALFRAGYTFSDGREPGSGQFGTLVSSKGKFYQIQIRFANGHLVKIRDSLKLFPMSVRRLAPAYGLEISKGEIDYHEFRPVGHIPTDVELDYILRDIGIPAAALNANYAEGFSRMTAGSNAFHDFKERFGKKRFKRVFPVLDGEVDTFLRKGYRGGFAYCNPEWAGKDTGRGISVDYNSMYPSQMLMNPFPVGKPLPFEGRYPQTAGYPLYVQMLTAEFHVKREGIPMVQLKNSYYGIHTYVEDANEPETLVLTSVDMGLFFDNYDVDVVSWDGGYMFMQQSHLFDCYIDHWADVKKKERGAKRQIAKLMLNSLYGKFGTNPDVTPKVPCFEDDRVKWELGEEDVRESVYVPVAMFATAYARRALFEGIKANLDRFVYCDTDSMHLIGEAPPKGIRLHDSDFGAWKVEGVFDRSRHLRAKAYVLDYGGALTVSCAGMPDNVKELVTFDNFHYGFTNCDAEGNVLEGHGKLTPKTVPGGCVLVPSPYVLHE